MSSRTVRVTAAAAVLLAGGVARAQVEAGDILVPEYSAGSVVNARDGGDLSGAPRFATGLTTPMGLCRGPGGHVYATEHDAGQVTIITAGGDFTGAAPFAFELDGPASLLCSETQILVTELNSAQVTDITAGGNFDGVLPFARIDRNPADLLLDSDGRLWVTSFNDGVIEITGGGDFRGDPYYAPNDLADDSSIALAQLGNRLLVGNEHTSEIVNFAAGGPLSGRPVFAQVDGVIGLRRAGPLLFAASERPPGGDGVLYEISAGGDYTDGDAPFATGLDPFDVAHLLYIAGGDPEPDIDAGPEPDPDAGVVPDPDGGADPDPDPDGDPDPDPDPDPGAGPDAGAKKGGGGGCSATGGGGGTWPLALAFLIAVIAGRRRRARRAAPARRR